MDYIIYYTGLITWLLIILAVLLVLLSLLLILRDSAKVLWEHIRFALYGKPQWYGFQNYTQMWEANVKDKRYWRLRKRNFPLLSRLVFKKVIMKARKERHNFLI